MKNIHILPTDKPSRLCIREFDNKLSLNTVKVTNHGINQYIYITNSEKPKLKDWFISGSLIHKATDILDCDDDGKLEIHSDGYCNPLSSVKKIILTTDQDLIKDGVQAIDDRFLEWFVNNPSCESVEIDNRPKISSSERGFVMDNPNYNKIIIPSEEICSFCYGTGQVVSSTTISRFKTCDCKLIPKEEPCTCTDKCLGYLTKTCKKIEEPKQTDEKGKHMTYWGGLEEPKQETTLEEVAERLKGKELFKESNDRARKILSEIKSLPIQETLEEATELFFRKKIAKNCTLYKAAKFGAKWQMERSYSEEEVIAFGEFIFKHSLLTHTKGVKSLFEQFKKK